MASNPFRAYDNNIGSVGRAQVKTIDGIATEGNTTGVVTLSRPSASIKMRLLIYATATVLSVLCLRIFYLQVVEGATYRDRSEGNRITEHRIPAPRGVVYDSAGNILAKNIPNFTLRVTATEMLHRTHPNYEEAYARLEAIISAAGIDTQDLADAVQRSRSTGLSTVVADNIEYSTAMNLIIDLQDVAGAEVEVAYAREYTHDPSYSHLIGYTGKMNAEEYERHQDEGYALDDFIGKTGIEYSYETILRGTNGNQRAEVNSRGVQTSILSNVEPIPGQNLHMAIDPKLQALLYEKLSAVVEEQQLPGASAVALDPRTGEVRAMVSYPSFDLNAFAGGIDTETYKQYIEDERRPLFNRSISGEYPSGSTFKLVVAAAALEEGVITRNTTVHSTGGLRIDQYFFPDWRAGGHGTVNVIGALSDSVNTFFYLAGGGDNETTTGLGVDRITEYGRRFGLDHQTAIDIPGEADGFLPSKSWKEEYKDEPWYIGDTYHLAIGQGDLLVTPLQVAYYTSIFANGGTAYQPRLISHTTNEYGQVIQQFEPVVQNEQVVSKSSINIVREGMRDAVLHGSARSLLTLPVSSAGKTGTAQFGSAEKTHSWFTAFAPYDSPEIAIAVLVEEGGGGNDAAVPIVRETLAAYFSPEAAAPEDQVESAETSAVEN